MYYSFSFQGRRRVPCSDSDLGTPSPTLLAFMRNSRGVKTQLTARPKSNVGPSPCRKPHTELWANLVQKHDWHFPLSFKTQYITIINNLKVRRFFWLDSTLVSFLFSTLSWKPNFWHAEFIFFHLRSSQNAWGRGSVVSALSSRCGQVSSRAKSRALPCQAWKASKSGHAHLSDLICADLCVTRWRCQAVPPLDLWTHGFIGLGCSAPQIPSSRLPCVSGVSGQTSPQRSSCLVLSVTAPPALSSLSPCFGFLPRT